MALPRVLFAVRCCLPSLVGLSRRAVNIGVGRPAARFPFAEKPGSPDPTISRQTTGASFPFGGLQSGSATPILSEIHEDACHAAFQLSVLHHRMLKGVAVLQRMRARPRYPDAALWGRLVAGGN